MGISLPLSLPGCGDTSGSDLFNPGSIPVPEIVALDVGEVLLAMDDAVDLPAGISKLDLSGFIGFDNRVEENWEGELGFLDLLRSSSCRGGGDGFSDCILGHRTLMTMIS